MESDASANRVSSVAVRVVGSAHGVRDRLGDAVRDDGPVDCVLVGVDGDAVAGEVEAAAASADGDPPLVAVAPDPAAHSDAIAAGAVDVLDPDDPALLDRLRSLARNGTPLAPDERTGAFGDACCALDGRWRVRESTPAFPSVLGADALAGRSFFAAVPDLFAGSLHDALWETALDGDPREVEFPLDERFLRAEVVAAAGGFLLRLTDVTDDVTARRARDRYERILETIEDGIYTLDENFRITGVNGAVTRMLGYERDELVGAHSTLLADETVIAEAGEKIQEILTGRREAGRFDVNLRAKDGERLPVETRFSALSFPDGSFGSVGVIRDIRDRKRFERTLTALARSTRELFRTETKPEVGRLVVDTATEVLDVDTVAVHLFYEEETTLIPVSWAGSGTPPAVAPGDGVLWDTFAEGTMRRLEATWGERAAEGLALPLGEHGLLVTAQPAAGNAAEHRTLSGLLAANASAALDRVDRSMELAQRERTLARRNEDLTRLNRFNELIRDVNRVLVECDTRETIERAVCERLADSPQVAFAWLGEFDHVSESVIPRTWAGDDGGYLDQPIPADEPAAVCARSDEPTLVESIASGLQRHPWRQRALARDFRSAVSVPVVYNDYHYGVLTVYASEEEALDEATLTTLAELGVTTANAVSNARAKESLRTEAVVELDLRVPAPNAPLLRLARAFDGPIELGGSVPGSAGTLLYLSVPPGDDVAARAERVAVVERASVVAERDDETLVEVLVSAPTLPTRLADHGGAVRTLLVDVDAIEVTVELPAGADVREFVASLSGPYPGTELTAKHTRDRPVETRTAFLSRVRDDLTDRQFEVLRTAFFSGYFAWPRERSGEAVAASLDISQPTFSRHLRVAQQKLFASLFAE